MLVECPDPTEHELVLELANRMRWARRSRARHELGHERMLDERWYRCLEVGGWHYLVQGTGTGDTSIIRRAHREGVLDAVRLGLSNGRLEGLNSKVRLISHRSFSFHSAAALIAWSTSAAAGSRSISLSHDSGNRTTETRGDL